MFDIYKDRDNYFVALKTNCEDVNNIKLPAAAFKYIHVDVWKFMKTKTLFGGQLKDFDLLQIAFVNKCPNTR